MHDARFEITIVRRFSDTRSSMQLEFFQSLMQAEARRIELIREFVDNEGFDQVSHEDRVTVLEFRECNNYFALQSWDSPSFTVVIRIRPSGIREEA